MNMYLVCVLFFIHAAYSGVLPPSLAQNSCHKEDPAYDKCVYNELVQGIPLLAKGVPELNIPAMDPFELPYVEVNRTLNDLVSISAILKNVKSTGILNTIVESVKYSPDSKLRTMEFRFTIPSAYLEMEYDVKGQLLVVPLQSKGFFKGNFTDIKFYVKKSLKTYLKDGEEYFKLDKITMKSTVGNGWVKLIAKNPELQFGADLISNFYNENPRMVMDAINPIYVEFTKDLMRAVEDQILSTIPAKELSIY